MCVCTLRSCVRWILYWYAYPSGCYFFHVLLSKVLWWHFSLQLAYCGSLDVQRRGGQHGADAFLSEDKEPLHHPLFFSSLLSFQLSSAAHQSGALHMKRAPVFMPRKLAYRRPSPTHFTKTPSHLCHVREGRPSSAGSPLFLSSLFSSVSDCHGFQPLKLWLWREEEGEERVGQGEDQSKPDKKKERVNKKKWGG